MNNGPRSHCDSLDAGVCTRTGRLVPGQTPFERKSLLKRSATNMEVEFTPCFVFGKLSFQGPGRALPSGRCSAGKTLDQ